MTTVECQIEEQLMNRLKTLQVRVSKDNQDSANLENKPIKNQRSGYNEQK